MFTMRPYHFVFQNNIRLKTGVLSRNWLALKKLLAVQYIFFRLIYVLLVHSVLFCKPTIISNIDSPIFEMSSNSGSQNLWKKCKRWWSTIPAITTKPSITSHLNSLNITKLPRHITLKIQVMAWERHTSVARLNRLMGFKTSSLDNWISNSNTYINKRQRIPKEQYKIDNPENRAT